MIFTATYVMFWMGADLLRGHLGVGGGGGWALEIETFLCPEIATRNQQETVKYIKERSCT
jgi:hypothetical protein